jgi:hypothetical protein
VVTIPKETEAVALGQIGYAAVLFFQDPLLGSNRRTRSGATPFGSPLCSPQFLRGQLLSRCRPRPSVTDTHENLIFALEPVVALATAVSIGDEALILADILEIELRA